MKTDLVIHIDGACRGNPGPSSVGIEIRDAKSRVVQTISESIGNATNNVAEYMALVLALEESVALKAKRVSIYTDSELMSRQLNGEYRVKDPVIRLLNFQARRLTRRFQECRICHISREENKNADRLANEALNREALL